MLAGACKAAAAASAVLAVWWAPLAEVANVLLLWLLLSTATRPVRQDAWRATLRRLTAAVTRMSITLRAMIA